ncbi:MAG TPA: hypothetical protein VIS07_19325 [Candidatus Binatia bacterium]
MKKFVLLTAVAIGMAGVSVGCSDNVKRTTTTYRESSTASVPSGTAVIAPSDPFDDTTTTTTRTKRVEERYED